MTQLHRRARDLIARAADGDRPTRAQRARLRASVLAQVGGAVVAGAAGTAAGTKVAAAAVATAEAGAPAALTGVSAAAGGSLATLAAKVVTVAALTLGVGTGSYVLVAHHAQDSTVAESTPAATFSVPRTTLPSTSPPVAPPPIALSEPKSAPDNRGSAGNAGPQSRGAIARTVEPRAAVSPSSGSAETLEAETRSLRDALASLRDGQAERALAALDDQNVLFAHGALGEEREATRIDALCALGRTDEARAAATRFLDEHPRSLLATRVRASCGGVGSSL